LRWLIAARLAHDFGWNTGHSFARRYFFQHNRTCCNATAISNGDVAQNLGTCPDQNTVFNVRVANFFFLAGPAQCY
jgi:hypothetical protein